MEFVLFLVWLLVLVVGVVMGVVLSAAAMIILYEGANCAWLAAILAVAMFFGSWLSWGRVVSHAPTFVSWGNAPQEILVRPSE